MSYPKQSHSLQSLVELEQRLHSSSSSVRNLESKSLRDAFIDLIAAYYVFDIAYPKSVAGAMLLFQHYVFNLKDQQQPPSCLCKLVHNLYAMD